MEKTTDQQTSGKKVTGESTGLPMQNTKPNLADKAPSGRVGSTAPTSGSLGEVGYVRESM